MLDKIKSYVFGLLITDGTLYLAKTRNRGKVTLEVNEKDKDIVEKLHNLYPESHIRIRTRSTNFSKSYTSYSFVNGTLDFRTNLIESGYPKKDKTNLASIPTVDYSELDFWRGVIDGDGSIGFSKNDIPFIGLVTKSEDMKTKFLDFLDKRMNLQKSATRNKRDNIYNIMITNEAAVDLAKLLYIFENPEIYIDRKYKSAVELQNWTRTKPIRPWKSGYKTRITF